MGKFSENLNLRLFVAILLPEAVKEQLEQVQAKLRGPLPEASVRWTNREQFHLTLKFLGDVDAGRLDPLVDALQSAAGNFAPLDLRAEEVGFFPHERRPRVIWVGAEDAHHTLANLQQAVEAAVRDFSNERLQDRAKDLQSAPAPPRSSTGNAGTARPNSVQEFTGHVTLGRIKSLRPSLARDLALLASTLSNRNFGQWTTDRIDLMRSELSPMALGTHP